MNVRATVSLSLLTLSLAACTGHQAVQNAGGAARTLDYYQTVFSDDFETDTLGLSKTVLNHWSMVYGNIDLIGSGLFGELCQAALMTGNCVDLDGSAFIDGSGNVNLGSPNRLWSEPITLAAGNYELSFKAAGSQRSGSAYDQATFGFGVFNSGYDVSAGLGWQFVGLMYDAKASTYKYSFTVPANAPAQVIDIIHSGPADNQGLLLDDVAITRIYGFTGFFPPVANQPVVNTVKAGQSIPLKFSFGADLGLNIVKSVNVSQVACEAGDPTATLDDAVTAGGSGLSYDAVTKQYTWVWKTQKSYAGKCIDITMNFDKGDSETASFKFTK